MLPNGDLMIINITRSDAQMTYRCRTHHRLTQETLVSRNIGRVQLTGTCKLISSIKIHPSEEINKHHKKYQMKKNMNNVYIIILKTKKKKKSLVIRFKSIELAHKLYPVYTTST